MEENIIGNLLQHGRESMSLVCETIDETDFLEPVYRQAFKTMKDLYKEGRDWDFPMIAMGFKNSEHMGATILAKTLDMHISLDMLPHKAIELKKRNLDYEIRTAMQMGADYKEIKEKIIELENAGLNKDLAIGSKQAVIDALDRLQRKKELGIELDVGWHRFDKKFGGLHRGDLMSIGGRTGHGKTNLALNMALRILRKGKKVLFFNVEMSEDELIYRLFCMEKGINSEKIRNLDLSEIEWDMLAKAGNEVSKYNLNLYCHGSIKTSHIDYLIKRYQPDVVFVDYIQALTDTQGKESRAQHLSNISRSLKILARENNVCMIALSQLNRGIEYRADKTEGEKDPELSDIKESGGIEEASDIVLLIWKYFKEGTNYLNVKVAKNRHGESNVGLQFEFNVENLILREI